MATVVVSGTPQDIQIPADATGSRTVTVDAATETLTLAKLTPRGSAGSVTIKSGKVTSYTKPT